MAISRVGLRPGVAAAVLTFAVWLGAAALPAGSPEALRQPKAASAAHQSQAFQSSATDFERMVRQQAETDRTWRAASAGFMRMEKIVYRSRVGDLDVPAFVFQPLTSRGPKTQPALVWVHENIRGHLYEHYIPFIRSATAQGYVVIAPEYRGSIGYGKAYYDAIDYGGAEVDDVVTAANVLASRYPQVDPSRVAILGWSHGGLIAMLSVFRNPATFKAAAAIVPVANLIYRLSAKGAEQRYLIDPQNRLGGLPSEKPEVYRARSPLFQVDALRIPLLVHVAANDSDVSIDESQPLVDALRARKPLLAETKVYERPLGGHTFDRQVDRTTWQPVNTPEQRDSWNRVWSFLEANLEPSHERTETPPALTHTPIGR